MATWSEFETAVPGLANIVSERFAAFQVVLVGTLRRDGSPRVTPIEYEIINGQFYFGGMWQSKKCLDMERDPRIVFHSPVTQKSGEEGDVKVYGFARTVVEPAERAQYGEALFAATGFRPEEPYHLFRLDVREVGFVVFAGGIEAFRERLDTTPQVQVHLHGADPNTSGYLVATWKAGGQAAE